MTGTITPPQAPPPPPPVDKKAEKAAKKAKQSNRPEGAADEKIGRASCRERV